MDPFSWLDAVFGGGDSGTVKGSMPIGQGFAPVVGWMVGQCFAGAGPVGQYMGMLYGNPGTEIPNTDWAAVKAEEEWWKQRDRGDYYDFTDFPISTSYSVKTQPDESRTLEVLDRGQGELAPASGPIEEVFDRGQGEPAPASGGYEVVNVFGSPPDRPSPRNDWWPGMDAYLASQRRDTDSGGEIQLRLDDPLPRRPPKPRRPAAIKPSPADATAPAQAEPRPERDPVDSGPYFGLDVTPFRVPGSGLASNPWMSDAAVPEGFLPWGSWDRPENMPSPRLERGDTGRIETVPTLPVERSFWSRGGTGLAVGAMITAGAVAGLMWWNPVGWYALGTALAIAGGVAATTASAVELTASYSGATTPEQDAQMNRSVSAVLGYSSPLGVLGSVLGTVWADDPEEGFLQGAMWGGFVEGAASLPGVLRALPGLWRAAMPWAKSLLLTPAWFYLGAGGGGGSVRSLTRVWIAQGRIASRVRQVEYLGTTPLLERDANWARYQVFVTRTRNESVFRITYANGQQRIVNADYAHPTSLKILDPKEGNLGQMFVPEREAHIMRQAQNYIDITTVTGGEVGYPVSTELGASRLTQRFGREFPAEMASGQMWIDWVPWRR